MSHDIPKIETSQSKSHTVLEKKEWRLHTQIASLIRVMTDNFSLSVTTELGTFGEAMVGQKKQDPNTVWYAKYKQDPETGLPLPEVEFVRIPEMICERSEEIALGKAAHEAAHVVSSRFNVIPKDVFKLQGFSGLMAAIEERPTDEVVRERLIVGKEWIDGVRRDLVIDYLESMEKEIDTMFNSLRGGNTAVQETESSDSHAEVEQTFDRANESEMPRAEAEEQSETAQEENIEQAEKQYNLDMMRFVLLRKPRSRYGDFCNLLVFAPHHSEQEKMALFHPDAVRAYKEVQEIVERIESTIPSKGSDEAVIALEQKKRYAMTYKYILPKAQDLILADLEDQKRQQATERNIRDQLDQSDEKKGIKEDVRDIMDQIEDVEREAQEQEAECIKEITGDISEEKKQELEKKMDEAREKAREALKKLFDELWKKMPDWLKKMIEEAAKKQMEDVEDGVIKEYGGKLSSDPIQTKAEQREEIEAQQAQEKEDEEEKKAMEKRAKEERHREKQRKDIEQKMKEGGIKQTLYEKEYPQVRDTEQDLYRELDEVLYPNVASQTSFHSTGSHINVKKLFLWKGQKEGGASEITIKPFEQTRHLEAKDYVITLLVDLSGSMAEGARSQVLRGGDILQKIDEASVGSKIRETFKAVIVLTEVLNRLGIRFNVLGLEDMVVPFKDFDEELTDAKRTLFSGMVYEVYSQNPGGRNFGGNADGECVYQASELLAKESASEKILIVLSDGLPINIGKRANELRIGNASNHLLYEVQRIIRETDQKIIGIGLGKGTEHVKDYYPISLPNIPLAELPERLGDILRLILTQPDVLDEAMNRMRNAGDASVNKDDNSYHDSDDEW